MNWSKWSPIAEIASSIAILVTLVYLTVEVRQNTVATQAGTREGVLQGELQFLAATLEDPELLVLNAQQETPDDADAMRLQTWLIMFMRLRESNYRQYQSGVLDEETWANLRSSITNGPLSTVNGRRWWENIGRTFFDSGLVAEIDQTLRSTPVAGSTSANFRPIAGESFR